MQYKFHKKSISVNIMKIDIFIKLGFAHRFSKKQVADIIEVFL